MPQSTVAAKIHEALDVHLDLTAQCAFNRKIAFNIVADCDHFSIREFIQSSGLINVQRVADVARRRMANSVNACQCDRYALSRWEIYA